MSHYAATITYTDTGTTIPGWEASTHNAALRGTRRMLSGQGYRAVPTHSHAGHLELVNPDRRVIITIHKVK